MWQQLGSPPENFRNYQFEERKDNHEQERCKKQLESNKKILFEKDKQWMDDGSMTGNRNKLGDQKCCKPQLCLTRTSAMKCKHSLESDKTKQKINHRNMGHTQSKSVLYSNQKQHSLFLLSQNQTFIKEESSKISISAKQPNLYSQSNKSVNSFKINDESNEEASLSEIFMRDTSNAQNCNTNFVNLNSSVYFSEMSETLKQIRDITKQNLMVKLKLIKLLEEKHTFYGFKAKDHSQTKKINKNQKEIIKSIKRNPEKSSKKGNNLIFEERISKIQQKAIKLTTKKNEGSKLKKNNFLDTKKKSLSILR